jgi:hypothetical protein
MQNNCRRSSTSKQLMINLYMASLQSQEMKVVRRKWHARVKSMSATNHRLFHYYSSIICVYQNILSTIITALRTQIMYGLHIMISAPELCMCIWTHVIHFSHIPAQQTFGNTAICGNWFIPICLYILSCINGNMLTGCYSTFRQRRPLSVSLSVCSGICFSRNEGEGLQHRCTSAM